MIFRFRFREAGGHTHIRFFAGKSEASLGKAGEFVLRNEEWAEFKKTFSFVPLSQGTVQFLEEDAPVNQG